MWHDSILVSKIRSLQQSQCDSKPHPQQPGATPTRHRPRNPAPTKGQSVDSGLAECSAEERSLLHRASPGRGVNVGIEFVIVEQKFEPFDFGDCYRTASFETCVAWSFDRFALELELSKPITVAHRGMHAGVVGAAVAAMVGIDAERVPGADEGLRSDGDGAAMPITQ